MAMTDKNADTKVDVKPETTITQQPRGERQMRRWDPFEALDELQNEMLRLWGQAFPLMPRPLSRSLRRIAPTPMTWMPSVDVYQQDGNLMVKAELPGVKKEDIDITLDQGDLVIRGERKAEHEVKEDQYYRMECSYGSFYRRIPLPSGVKADQIKATYKDGVLEVHIPTPAQEQPQAQKVPVSG
jgi:HSP20 family protein